MNLLSVTDICKAYGAKKILDNITFGIDSGDKIGVIGVNGTGKSTLLKIIAGIEEADSGKIVTMNGLRMAYLPQTPVFEAGQVVMEYMVDVCGLTDAEAESDAKSVLTRLGIFDFYKDVSELSGGQRKRVALAAAMIAPVDLLILDEPTNHVDAQAVEWLEDNLKRSAKALLMITHDRYFLDRVANKTIELCEGCMYTYTGNYTAFLEQKSLREELAEANERKRQSFLRTELEWVRRGARARTTKQKARLERYNEINSIQAPTQRQNIEIAGLSSRLGRKTINIENITKAYGDKVLIDGFSYTVLKNDRIGIIGSNGCGKSTLLNIIAGYIKPDSGCVELGDTVKLGFFKQESFEMNENDRVVDYVKEVGEFITTKTGKLSATRLLERFLFTADMQYSPIGKLSGGERRRLQLMRVLMAAPNILLLDEPTNDLDIDTLMILENYLDGFEGAVIVVSHDRYFLDRTVDRIFALEGNGVVTQYEGNYTDYENRRKENKTEAELTAKKSAKTYDKGAKKLKMSYNEQREFETIDADIEKIEAELKAIDTQMEEAASSYSKLQELTALRAEAENRLEEKTERWLYLNELNEAIENQ
jgi:ATP-binding cassette subfamily F protein uup